MNWRPLVFVIVGLPIFVALMYFFVLPYAYVTSENNNFENMRKKSLLDCQVLPLHCLIREGVGEKIETYIESGADLEIKDNWGQSALFWGVNNREIEHVGQLLAAGADPNAQDERGERVLLVAMLLRSWQLADQLVASGADLNGMVGINNTQTLLHYCVLKNKRDCVAYLLKNGANSAIKDSFGFTVLERIESNHFISDPIKSLFTRTNEKPASVPIVEDADSTVKPR